MDKIMEYTPNHIKIISQGEYVANSLKDYLSRHTEIATRCTKGATCRFLTTESAEKFNESASIFLSHQVEAERVVLG
jgi:glutamate racemase